MPTLDDDDATRCQWAIQFQPRLHTRCLLESGHPGPHEGWSTLRMPYQQITWAPRDPREYRTTQEAEAAWEEDSGPMPGDVGDPPR